VDEDDVSLVLADAEVDAVLKEAIETLDGRGYPVEFGAFVVSGTAPDGGSFRGVRAVSRRGEEKETVRLLLWGAQSVAIKIGLVEEDDEAGEGDERAEES
jgi:hypothetical protein